MNWIKTLKVQAKYNQCYSSTCRFFRHMPFGKGTNCANLHSPRCTQLFEIFEQLSTKVKLNNWNQPGDNLSPTLNPPNSRGLKSSLTWGWISYWCTKSKRGTNCTPHEIVATLSPLSASNLVAIATIFVVGFLQLVPRSTRMKTIYKPKGTSQWWGVLACTLKGNIDN